LAYYPFYEAKLDNKEKLMIDKGENNVVKIIVPENSMGTIRIGYVKNLIWGISDCISALSLLFFIYLFAKKGKKISLLDKKIFLC
jgi:hypothetical protein